MLVVASGCPILHYPTSPCTVSVQYLLPHLRRTDHSLSDALTMTAGHRISCTRPVTLLLAPLAELPILQTCQLIISILRHAHPSKTGATYRRDLQACLPQTVGRMCLGHRYCEDRFILRSNVDPMATSCLSYKSLPTIRCRWFVTGHLVSSNLQAKAKSTRQ